ncbi:MAG: SDR family NAD(P)-dependent oxidoreductase [Lachnospiraceae bacterium]|nr:SDR family NAD(P)-dependent oxidoreductase [Lachnospiraceae bacterium]MBQ1516221.1 SDR family NAD(P)-dependent oxidoreductase [Lachnospiraceae bacterium]
MRLAIITGASSGLGREFALQITKKYADEFDEMWLIARRREQLEELSAQVDALAAQSGARVAAKPVPLDLTQTKDLDRFEAMIDEAAAAAEHAPGGSPDPSFEITYLVNAAGLGRFGRSEDIPRAAQRGMIDLNCGALVEVTAVCVPYLAHKAHVLQIASTAGFQPFQFLNIYAATKAFVIRYSQALAWELAGRRVRVTAVCPYWVKDTEFIGIARETGGKRANKHYPLASKTKNVVAHALAVNRTGYWVATPSLVSFVHRIWTKIAPTAAAMGVYELIRRV